MHAAHRRALTSERIGRRDAVPSNRAHQAVRCIGHAPHHLVVLDEEMWAPWSSPAAISEHNIASGSFRAAHRNACSSRL